jgi:hypothetical protein
MDIAWEILRQMLQVINDSTALIADRVHQSHVFAFCGVTLAVIGFWVFNSKPDSVSFATWFLFVIGDWSEATTFLSMTELEFLKNLVPVTFALGTTVTFFIVLRRRQFGWPSYVDLAVMCVDISIMLGWFRDRLNATGANILLVCTEFIAFMPAYKDVLMGKERPYIAPWMYWAGADACFYLTVISLPHNQEETIFPVLQMIAHFVMVGCIIVRRQRQALAAAE